MSSLFAVALEVVRVQYSGTHQYLFLVWNLFLAWLPLAFAGLFTLFLTRSAVLAVMSLVAWFLFLPNAPYMITDYVHLRHASRIPVWYDVLTISAFAWTAFLLGFASMLVLQPQAERKLGCRGTEISSILVSIAASCGVALGRFPQANSWDAIEDPRRVGALLSASAWSDEMVAFVIAFAALLIVMYGTLYSLTRP